MLVCLHSTYRHMKEMIGYPFSLYSWNKMIDWLLVSDDIVVYYEYELNESNDAKLSLIDSIVCLGWFTFF